jgi:heme a synthase
MSTLTIPAQDFSAPAKAPPNRRGVVGWLYLIALMIFIMVLIGGATRLTDSGLSITEWEPIMGAIPPLSMADWNIAFEKYKQIPEFKLQNSQMTMTEFQFIYFWEWIHRFWGRVIGVAFALGVVYFGLRRRLSLGLLLKFLIIFALGFAQAYLGWWMVKSGLVERTDVSQYRLAAHLSLAAVLFAAVMWTAYAVRARHRFVLFSFHGLFAMVLFLLVLLQIGLGGLVAGLDAGMGYTTWPKMDGQWIPKGLDVMEPKWKNVFENALTVQFVHRVSAYLLLALAALHAFLSFRLSAMILFYGVLAQGILGIMTLMLKVPMPLALTHQGIAFVVLAVAVWNLHKQTEIKPSVL